MKSNLTQNMKKMILQRIADVNRKPISEEHKGFKIHIVKAKREGYTQGLEDALKIIEMIENRE